MAPLAAQDLVLPCGLKLKNRLVKAGMEECLASMFSNLPNEQHEILYSKWAEESDFGLLITGNVQVDPAHLGTPFDVAYQVSPDDSIRIEKIAHRWTSWALSCADTPCLVQLNHPGRQSPRGLKRWPWSPALAPTAIPLSSSDTTVGRLLESSVFGLVKEATRAELRQIVSQFVEAALHVHRSGFQGVQIHCSHGYLLCQMMSPITNQRKDEYGDTPFNRLRLLFEIIDGIRTACPAEFCVAVKINAHNGQTGGLGETETLQQVEWIIEHGGVDLIEISGGTYENPMFAEEMDRDTHGGYTTFASFSRQCKENMMRKRQGSSHSSSTTPLPAVMLTGGFRTQRAIEQSLSIAEADLIGIARPACVDPTWPARMLDPSRGSPDCLDYQPQGIDKIQPYIPLKIAGYGLGTGWHVFQLWKMAHRENTKPTRTFARLAFDELVPSWVKGAAIMGSVAVLNHILNPRRLGWGGASEFEYTQGL